MSNMSLGYDIYVTDQNQRIATSTADTMATTTILVSLQDITEAVGKSYSALLPRRKRACDLKEFQRRYHRQLTAREMNNFEKMIDRPSQPKFHGLKVYLRNVLQEKAIKA